MADFDLQILFSIFFSTSHNKPQTSNFVSLPTRRPLRETFIKVTNPKTVQSTVRTKAYKDRQEKQVVPYWMSQGQKKHIVKIGGIWLQAIF